MGFRFGGTTTTSCRLLVAGYLDTNYIHMYMQARALLTFMEAVMEKTLSSTVTLAITHSVFILHKV